MKPKLGRIIRDARSRAELTLTELARRVRVSPSYLCRLERDDPSRRPSDGLLDRLARVLSMPVDHVYVAAGRVPRDVVRFITSNPAELVRVRRRMGRAA